MPLLAFRFLLARDSLGLIWIWRLGRRRLAALAGGRAIAIGSALAILGPLGGRRMAFDGRHFDRLGRYVDCRTGNHVAWMIEMPPQLLGLEHTQFGRGIGLIGHSQVIGDL